ncbi:MAG: penicillin-binding transpeptidase domain-containing protein, partial [Blastocatellia bacterium]
DPARAKARRNQVLDSMVEAGYINQEQAATAEATPLDIQAKRSAANSGAPYFIDYLQQQIATEMSGRDLGRESYRVYTTIDLELQRAANKAVDNTLADLDKIFAKRRKNPLPPGTLQAALVALDPKTGDILAMVGGRDYSRSQLNRAVDAHRQPGSVFKPIVYTTALNTAYEEAGDNVLTPASLFLDSPETFYYSGGESYSPENFGKVYSNEKLLMREGLVHSLNVVTVRIAEKLGYEHVANMAERLGLPKPQPFPALALGTAEATPLEVARAYTAFANGGNLASTRPIERVTNADGAEVTEDKPVSRQVIRPTIAWLMTNMMQDVLNRGTAAGARRMGFTATAAGKTGTSHDGWFAGYTPNLVCVVWVGFDDNSELGLEGAKSALPIWANFMKQALALRPDLGGDSFPMPEGVVTADIDPTTGMLAVDGCPAKVTEYFVEGTQPTVNCTVHSPGQNPVPAPTPFVWPEDTAPPKPRDKEDTELDKSPAPPSL